MINLYLVLFLQSCYTFTQVFKYLGIFQNHLLKEVVKMILKTFDLLSFNYYLWKNTTTYLASFLQVLKAILYAYLASYLQVLKAILYAYLASYLSLKAIVYTHLFLSSGLKGQCIPTWTHKGHSVYALASYPSLKGQYMPTWPLILNS